MKKSWGLTQKILSGKKKIESRWYKSKCSPWGKIGKGDVVCFKDSGEPISIKTEVEKVKAAHPYEEVAFDVYPLENL